MVTNVLVSIGDHGATPVPPALADDVNLAGEEGVRGSHDTADVEVVLPVLDGDMEVVPSRVQVGDDRVASPIAVAIDDVAVIAASEKLAIQPRILGPGGRIGSDAGADGFIRHSGQATDQHEGDLHPDRGRTPEEVWTGASRPSSGRTGATDDVRAFKR
jgi:hypothetical protein